jgi:hypothetical protein
MGDGGKGSSPRPYSVDQETFADNWDKIFKKKKPDVEDGYEQEERLERIAKES